MQKQAIKPVEESGLAVARSEEMVKSDTSSINLSISNDACYSDYRRAEETLDNTPTIIARDYSCTRKAVNWTVEDVGDWLVSVGYGQYRGVFISNGITGDLLIGADNAMLKELEITSVGLRVKLLKRLRKLFGLDDRNSIILSSEEYRRIETLIRERGYYYLLIF